MVSISLLQKLLLAHYLGGIERGRHAVLTLDPGDAKARWVLLLRHVRILQSLLSLCLLSLYQPILLHQTCVDRTAYVVKHILIVVIYLLLNHLILILLLHLVLVHNLVIRKPH